MYKKNCTDSHTIYKYGIIIIIDRLRYKCSQSVKKKRCVTLDASAILIFAIFFPLSQFLFYPIHFYAYFLFVATYPTGLADALRDY